KRSSSAVPPAEAGGARVVGIARAEALAVSRDGRAVAAAACEIDEAEEHLGRVAAVGVAVEIVLEIGARGVEILQLDELEPRDGIEGVLGLARARVDPAIGGDGAGG